MTRIGLLSDSHGRSQTTRQAAQLLVARGATMLLHLGDVGSVEVIDAMAGLVDAQGRDIPVRIVFGNTDWDAPSLQRYARCIGVAVDHPAGCLGLDEKGNVASDESAAAKTPDAHSLIFTHGHEMAIMENAMARQVRYLCHGHTHVAADQRVGRTRVINPGALFRARTYTAAILDTENDHVTFYPIGRV